MFTGFRDEELEKHVVRQGGQITKNLSKSVTILIVKDDSVSNNKVTYAKDNGIRISSRDNLRI